MSAGPLRVGEEPPPLNGGPARPSNRRQPTAKAKAAGRFHDLNAFVDGSLVGLTRAEIAVWLVLFRDARNGIAATAQEDIARRAGCDRRTVNRALRRLGQLDLVKLVRRGGLDGTVSHYRVHPKTRRP
jgi:DNA-binding MarR family transcriptional regulator